MYTLPLKAERYGWISVMLVFQSTFGVFGAGPALNLVSAESPWYWGHSYSFREVAAWATCTLDRMEYADVNSIQTKIIVIACFFWMTVSPVFFRAERN